MHDYGLRAAELRRSALAKGTIDYHQVLAAAYQPGVISEEILQAKAQWRATAPTGFEFITDYGLMRKRATVRTLVPVPDPALHSTLVAQYEATSHVIGLSDSASDFTVYHETGHSLQRAVLSNRGNPAGRRARQPESLLDRLLLAITADNTSARRLKYLCSQDEFEVRLQDLNRFHALLVAGRPIMTPVDTVRALSALGMPLSFEEAGAAFQAGGMALSQSDFENLSCDPPASTTALSVAFEDAGELLLLRSCALRVDEALWQRMLAKIIFEAPGHL